MPKKRKTVTVKRGIQLPQLFFLSIPLVFVFVFAILFFTAKSNSANIAAGCEVSDFSGRFDPEAKFAFIDGTKVVLQQQAAPALGSASVLGETSDEKWIEVDLSEQKLIAWEGNKVFLQTPISSGLPWWPTPTGEFRIWIKLRYTKMEGGQGKYYYNLPNVPFTMFFENDKVPGWKGYGLHGTYWHNDFGTPRSHGCVNLPTPAAEKLFYWTEPAIPTGKNVVRATKNNPGTHIVIHK